MGLLAKLFAKPWRSLSFAELAPRIKATLQAGAFPPGVLQMGAGALSFALAVDDGGKPALVERTDAARWGQTPERLWARARGNLARDPALLLRPFEMPSEIPVTVQLITSENEFAAGRLLLLDELAPGANGAVVTVAVQNVAAFLPLPNPRLSIANVLMIAGAQSMFDDGPGSISPHLYWWRAGRFDKLTERPVPGELPSFAANELTAEFFRMMALPENRP